MFFPRRESVRLLLDQFSKPQSVVKFTHQDQAAVGSDARALEGDLEGGVEEELKRLVWGFTHWVLAHRQRRETIPSFTTVCSYSGCSGHFCTSFLQASDSVLDPPREAQSVAGNSAAAPKNSSHSQLPSANHPLDTNSRQWSSGLSAPRRWFLKTSRCRCTAYPLPSHPSLETGCTLAV